MYYIERFINAGLYLFLISFSKQVLHFGGSNEQQWRTAEENGVLE